MGIRVDKRTADFQFLLENVKKRQIEFGIHAGNAEKQDASATIGKIKSLLRGKNFSYAFDDNICALSAGQRLNLR